MKNILSLIVFGVSVLLLTFLGVPACKQASEKQQEKTMEKILEQGSGQKTDVDIEDQKITIESEGSKVEIKTGAEKWPSDAPVDVPELQAGKITGTTVSESEEGHNWTIRYNGVTISELDKYGALLKNNGFKIQTMKTPKGGMLNGEKGNISVIFTVGEDVSAVIISEMKN